MILTMCCSGKGKTNYRLKMLVVARGMGVVRITVWRVWGHEGSVLYLNCEGSDTTPYIVELCRTVHQKKNYHVLILKIK